MTAAAVQVPASSLRRMLVPLALAQFICSFAGSNMNVMITDISADLHTDVQGVQVCITLFLLVMAALMIPCGKLTDRYGRKWCFQLGLLIYGVGAVLSAAAPGLGVLIVGNSILEGVGTALLIPPVYILTTMLFGDMKSRARAFGVVSGMGGIGAATGPLIGGAITTAISWRAAFVFQALALHSGQMSVVQPLLVTELVFALILRRRWEEWHPHNGSEHPCFPSHHNGMCKLPPMCSGQRFLL